MADDVGMGKNTGKKCAEAALKKTQVKQQREVVKQEMEVVEQEGEAVAVESHTPLHNYTEQPQWMLSQCGMDPCE